ncbi:ThiF family adenylyltransferase [Burkholderia cepacia]|uniref:ThiF family adenylyltransferase n=1 Tax=Burkholderia cepacia TaxID=292 RepID=UPI001C95DEF4|nr:ThiF family adenylyltransferase [Burkholderia cepacia]MDN7894377.1 ThiF family adenylyltransferase [Burkholderia cepacia]
MSIDVTALGAEFPELLLESRRMDVSGTTYRLALPTFPEGRGFSAAELLLPKGFPDDASARIRLSGDAVLRVPHVEGNRLLCIDGDPGPGCGRTPQERVQLLLYAYYENFLAPWMCGELDKDFSKEPQNYWAIEVARARSATDPVFDVWTLDASPARATVREGLLLLPGRVVLAADEDAEFTRRMTRALGRRATQRVRVLIADIPINYAFEPNTWPNGTDAINRLLDVRLSDAQRAVFFGPIRSRRSKVHRIALFRNALGGFAYLLPGGPPTVIQEGSRARARPSPHKPLPLSVTRLDPAWTAGRDQHLEVYERQGKHVVVFGAGALGSPVTEHLAKAGVGRITLVDSDDLEPANVGRHLLGVDVVDEKKATAVAERINRSHPSCCVTPQVMSAERWLRGNVLDGVSAVIDLTGEPSVRWAVDRARRLHPCSLLVGWMEPFVAAAHACVLPTGAPWIADPSQPIDRMAELEAVVWPTDVMRQEPGCSSRFQAYTADQAGYAVALMAEQAIKLIDGMADAAAVTSWVRGQAFLDEHWPGLQLRRWANAASAHHGLMITRDFK